MGAWATKAARPLELLLGIIFLVAAVLKALDANLFVAQIHSYQIVTDPFLKGMVALVTLFAETFIGVALLIGLRLRGAVIALVQATLVFFTVVIIYAVTVHGLTDCGCFGKVKMTPPVAIGKNVIMMIMAGIVWLGIRGRGGAESVSLMMPRSLIAAGISVVLTAYAVPQVYETDSVPAQQTARTAETDEAGDAVSPAPSGPYANIVVESETGEVFDLGRGTHLVASLSMTCDHCMGEIPALNNLHLDPDLPPVVALAHEPDAGSLDLFVLQTDPLFPFHPLGNNFLRFSQFIGSSPPRLALVHDGEAIQVWDQTTPPGETIRETLESAGLAS